MYKAREMLSALLYYKRLVRGITNTSMRKNPHYVLSSIFLEYLHRRYQKLFTQNLKWVTLSDAALRRMAEDLEVTQNEYVDCESCAIANIQFPEKSSSSAAWFNVCSTVSMMKYKLLILFVPDVDENTVLISETMEHNLRNALRCEQLDSSCFILPLKNNVIEFASEARVSVMGSHKYIMLNETLQNYFLHPRFLHVNDVLRIDLKEHAHDHIYSGSAICIVVKALKVNRSGQSSNVGNCYVVRGESALFEVTSTTDYLPRERVHSFPDGVFLPRDRAAPSYRYPSALMEPLEHLESCIKPFLKKGLKDIRLNVKPVFLVKGPEGCGKSELVETAAKRMGLLFLNTDVMATFASMKTELMLRSMLETAESCTPCLLYINNIQTFGKTLEGQKDERAISDFAAAVARLSNKRYEFPLIVVASSDETDLPAELQRIFVETIRVKHLDQEKRAELISWLLSTRNLTATADLSKVAALCSDFKFADLLALSLHAVKFRCELTPPDKRCTLNLEQEDFDRAYEYMQSMYSDSKGAPHVAEVHWEDIGGLAELKHEIIRRIQLPLLNAFGFGQSGLLLYGPPGTGKTLLAKAVATEYQMSFLSIKGPELLNMYVGQSEENVRQIFESARSAAPCIIFFDELDSLAPNRGRAGDSGGVMDRIVSQLLAEMDGLEESGSIFIIGATNRPDLIDPALLRPGRFDKMLYVGIHSDRASKLSVLKAQTRKFEFREDGRELEQVVDRLPDNVTGADLYSVSSNAWLNAVRDVLAKHQETERTDNSHSVEEEGVIKDNVIVELRHLSDAICNLVPSVTDEEIERYNRMRVELSSL
ncbi:PREDICTED: peroxisome assembly factor 2 [Wasmannia auropunctata]|uniref:peroxisome assembly factor 2 n=1 Tax=Wasmannia auropunctata TaxID=64793 RepID=UPI0005EDCAC7|nr:PREDICTED: peroxisome assembly factor 2 [Wasmannia auropunctata]XP_011685327.1 PREDICTED: peroxisome assembly factor 2 [Wasmannia auropunctata]